MKRLLRKKGEAALSVRLADVLGDREVAKLAKLVEACGDQLDDRFVAKAIRNLFKVIPGSIKHKHLLPEEFHAMITAVETDGRHAVVTLADGTVLKSFESRQQFRNYYYCFRDLLPSQFTPESYQACRDVDFRYVRGDRMIRELVDRGLVVPHDASSFIECGAYNGWKALGFAKHLGPRGKILVLEIDELQYELARWNLEKNLDPDRFIALNTGVWSRVEERAYTFQHYASASLSEPDEHKHHTQARSVRTSTLDDILDQTDVEVFDFMNVQTGGSELQSVQGLEKNLDRIKVIWLGTHYRHEGVSSRYTSMKYLLERGCRIYGSVGKSFGEVTTIDDLDPTEVGGFWAVTPAFRDEIVPRAPASTRSRSTAQ